MEDRFAAWIQTPDRDNPGEQESSLLRSSPMERGFIRSVHLVADATRMDGRGCAAARDFRCR